MQKVQPMDQIVEYAQELFDATGTIDFFLILGLESRKDRNLDNYLVSPDGRRFEFPGFAKNFSPKIEAIIKKLHENGFEAEQVRGDNIKFKQMAINAGIGRWGKNSLIIHRIFGPWLRFVVIKTNHKFSDEPLSPEDPFFGRLVGSPLEPIFRKCEDCDKCVKACPISALQPFHIPDKEICTAYDQLGFPTMKLAQRCDFCLQACMPQR